MARYYPRALHFLVALTLVGGLASCIGTPVRHDESEIEKFPLKWTEEFTMPSLLDRVPEVSSQNDLAKLLEMHWYASIDIQVSESKEPQKVISCNDYFAVKTHRLRAQREPEHNALIELMVMCEATRLLSEASPAQQSNIPPQPLGAELPNTLPKALALVTSQSEWSRIESDSNVSHWGEVNSVNEVVQTSAHQTEYRSDAGLQTVSILGRGDFDEDGREDLLISVEDTVEGGSYFNMRLFVFTVTDQGNWQVEAK